MTLSQEHESPTGVNQEDLIRKITNRIRLSLELQEILNTTVTEVRSFLGTDRVMIYKFHADDSGQVIAESINQDRFPSLLGLNFPADDIPPDARELFVKAKVRSVANVETNQMGHSVVHHLDTGEVVSENIRYRSIDPCHVEYLTTMGVKSTTTVPILHQNRLWGLLVSHHAEARTVVESELAAIQMVVDQLAIAIAQSSLFTQTKEKAAREGVINQISRLLHSLPTINFQPALEAVIQELNGSGGRLCIRNQAFEIESNCIKSLGDCLRGGEQIQVYTYGKQPVVPQLSQHKIIEQYHCWQEHYQSGNYDIWAITDIQQHSELRNLLPCFQDTGIRSILIIPLEYRQQLLGYLTIFRDEIDTETLWAGQYDTDQRQLYPRLSFDIWRESKKNVARCWTQTEQELAIEVGKQFASAIQQYELYQQVHQLNSNLETQVKERTQELQLAVEQQRLLFEIVVKIRQSLDLDSIFLATASELRQFLSADRVVVYRFIPESELDAGEIVAEDVLPEYVSAIALKIQDNCFKQKYLELGKQGKVRAIADIYNAGLTDCHVKMLEKLQVRANLIIPLTEGDELWGLLCIHQCDRPRIWEETEINFVSQIATQLSVAIEQADLLKQTQQKTLEIEQANEQQRILFDVVAKMRTSLDLEQIFNTMSQEVRKALDTDRVAVFRFDPAAAYNYGEFIAEDVSLDFPSALAAKIKDHCFGENYAQKYSIGRVCVTHDIYKAGFQDCHIAILERFAVYASIIAPIMKGEQLWGLLCIHECGQPRQWLESEIQFATQIATQLSVALEQGDLLAQSQLQAEQVAQTLQDLQQMQTKLIQNEKMSSLGQLVAGIAHEINNPVNFIYGNINHATQYTEDLLGMLDLYQQQCSHTSEEIIERADTIDLEFIIEDLPKMLSSMKVGTERIRHIVLSLRNFSRLDEAEMKAVDIHEGIDSTLLILKHRIKSKPDSSSIEIIKNYGQLPLVECYAGQLNQVFMNVISNAIDALEAYQDSLPESEHHHSKIVITTSLSPQNTASDNPRKNVIIQISDNGAGIPENIISRIFDPFFTTKQVGKGTGLGLSISYQIVVEKHGGVFQCKSQPGKGTDFWIEIPLLTPCTNKG
ncbi:GAF domain-containing sensor histidine kinase [Calothrix sp. 336/3]|uniref:GAF domain-containing sensor histidine kinase n=1 Tax=Calothrix sp. 336/3 TaxID=1337936 RepID=UPI0004E33680|nr:GAF domain-containing protein [Calothrix sp. 336/3]AKG21775.1 histidine kinase [Calothrix sp. 336/3]